MGTRTRPKYEAAPAMVRKYTAARATLVSYNAVIVNHLGYGAICGQMLAAQLL